MTDQRPADPDQSAVLDATREPEPSVPEPRRASRGWPIGDRRPHPPGRARRGAWRLGPRSGLVVGGDACGRQRRRSCPRCWTRGVDPAAERAIGADVVTRLLRQQADTDTAAGLIALDRGSRARLHSAVMDSLFGLGRLQPLVDLTRDRERRAVRVPTHGAVLRRRPRSFRGPPVAESDEELLEMLAWIAARQRGGQRPFSPAHPRLHLRLDNGARLAAIAWVSSRAGRGDPAAPARQGDPGRSGPPGA